jgi:hypothetical protein
LAMTALEVALTYIGRGWNPVPCDYKSKKPIGDDWQRRVINTETASRFFNGDPKNVGVILGATSHGLTDVDLDCAEAVALAPYILPPTSAIFGRPSARASHRLYQTDLGTTTDTAALQFRDPKTKAMLVELRIGGGGKGAQTIFPGSTHAETGEPIQWEENGEPARVTHLQEDVRVLAACCLLARYWPPARSSRHTYALTVGGFLSRAGADPARIKVAVEAIARAAGDEEWRDRRKAAEDAANAHHEGKRTYGLTALRDLYGPEVADQVAQWLDYRSGEEPVDDVNTPEQTPLANLGEWDAGNDTEMPPPRGWLLGNIFARKFMSSLLADGGVGKTALRYAQLLSVAIGRSLTGDHVFARCRVLIISLEDGPDELRRRILAHRPVRTTWLVIPVRARGRCRQADDPRQDRPNPTRRIGQRYRSRRHPAQNRPRQHRSLRQGALGRGKLE